MPNVKVMHFGLGPIGAAIVRQVDQRPDSRLWGNRYRSAKVGRDLGDVVACRRPRRQMSGDAVKALKSAKPDVVMLCTASWIKKVMP
jgi:hypothetical protein